jgi:hypothetical protein
MYETALLVAAAADEARIAEPEGITSWADEILQLEALRESNVRLLEAKGWSGEETVVSGDGWSWEPEPPALSVGGTSNGWVDISDLVICDGDGDAGA